MPLSAAWNDAATAPLRFEEALALQGEHGQAVLDTDWASTPLGPIEAWPSSLRAIVATIMASAQPMALWYGPELTTIFNEGFRPILGAKAAAALGRPLDEVWSDVWDDILPLLRRALSGETIWMENLPLTMTRNGFPEETHWTFSYSPVRDDAGAVVGLLDVVTETTEAVRRRAEGGAVNSALEIQVETANRALNAQHRAEEEQKALKGELVHRMKNLLAVVQAIVSQSIRSAGSVDEALDSVSARLSAFGRAQDILTQEHWVETDLGRVIDVALSPLQDFEDRFEISGPQVKVTAQQSLGLALALHELATNATKYGALSTDRGQVRIGWSVEDEDFTFHWIETGGPAVTEPVRKGFGSKLTERIVAGYFSGTASISFEKTGVSYHLKGRLAPLHTAMSETGASSSF